MSLWYAIAYAYENALQFDGRTRRRDYWNFALFALFVQMAPLVVLPITAGLVASAILSLTMLLPSVSMAYRRLHDTGRSGVWLLLAFTGLGSFVLLAWMCLDGDEGNNEYGPSPKAGHDVTTAMPDSIANNTAVATSTFVEGMIGPLKGKSWPISESGLEFGRDLNCNVVFPDKTAGVSAHHCRIVAQPDGIYIMDLGSTYGTMLDDGTMLPAGQWQVLLAGSRFYLGSRNNMFFVGTR